MKDKAIFSNNILTFLQATLYFCVLFWSYVCNDTFSLSGKSAKKSELLVFKHKLRTSLEISKLVVSSKKGWWYQLFIEHQSFIAIKIFWTWKIFCSTFERICNYPLFFSISDNVEIFVECIFSLFHNMIELTFIVYPIDHQYFVCSIKIAKHV